MWIKKPLLANNTNSKRKNQSLSTKGAKMSKDIEKLINIIHTGRKQKMSDKSIAVRIRVDGFRDITDLRYWLDEKWNFDYNDAWYLALEPVDKGKVQMARAVLDRLREL
jgi:hypothetical protein